MGQKRILPEHIKSVKHSFEDMSGKIEELWSDRVLCGYNWQWLETSREVV